MTIKLLFAVGAAAIAGPAAAGVTLTFEGIPNYNRPASFYAGGSSVFAGSGSGPTATGPDLGVTIADAAMILKRNDYCAAPDFCGTSGIFPDAPSGIAALYNFPSLSSSPAISTINLAAGFSGSVSVWHYGSASGMAVYRDVGGRDGNGGNGVALGVVQMAQTQGCVLVGLAISGCAWTQYTLAFDGTAHSVVLAGPAAYFDDLTLGASGVPEPATWSMLLAGFALTGAALRRRERVGTRSMTP